VIAYKQGDCPVAEKVCSETELTIYTGGLVGECDPLLDQIAEAFGKVTSQPDEIMALPEKTP
jgi:hypothetical protein